MVQPEVIVIGGGAAGFFGAIACGSTYPDRQITLLEAGSEPLTKVRISGGGRCNVTHHCFEPSQLIDYYPRGGRALRGAFSRFQPKDTVAWFEAQGVKLKTEADGRMFPVTDDSATIVECLMEAAALNGVKLMTHSSVQSVSKRSDGFEVTLKKGSILKCDRLLLATGSNPLGYRWAKELGHTVEKPVPSLFTFQVDDPRLKDLAGVSVENAHVRLLTSDRTKLEQTGPILITHWGLSGPAVLKLSAWGARVLYDRQYQMTLQINWLPQDNSETIRQLLINNKIEHPKRKIFSYCPFSLPKRLWQSLIAYLKIEIETPWVALSKSNLNQLVQELTQSQYQIRGKGVFKEEFVTCGGVSLPEIDFKTMESKICSGLYFAGEILDIDGVTGGFNFQSAWTTSWLAGKAMGRV